MGLLDSVGGFLNKASGGMFRFTPIGMAMEGLDFLGDLKSKGIGGAFKELAGDYFDSSANLATGGAYGLVTGKFLPPGLGLAGGLLQMGMGMGGMNAGANFGINGGGFGVNYGVGYGGGFNTGINGSINGGFFPQVVGGGYPPSVFDRGGFGGPNITANADALFGATNENSLSPTERQAYSQMSDKDKAAFMLQKQMQDYSRMVQLMTQLLTLMHETTKSIIQNVRA